MSAESTHPTLQTSNGGFQGADGRRSDDGDCFHVTYVRENPLRDTCDPKIETSEESEGKRSQAPPAGSTSPQRTRHIFLLSVTLTLHNQGRLFETTK